MANYLEMNREELTAEKAKLNEQYKKFLAMNLKLNMARGKPGPVSYTHLTLPTKLEV